MPAAPKTACPKCKQATAGPCQNCAPKVHIVWGAPGSGKTTYALDSMRRGDIIIDLDRLFVALTGCDMYDKPRRALGYVLGVYSAAVSMRASGGRELENTRWIVTSGKTRAERMGLHRQFPRAEWHHMDAPREECIRRIKYDWRRETNFSNWKKIVEKWFDEFED